MAKKINSKKKEEVEDVKRLVNEYPVMGIVNLENLPAFQLLRIKHNLGNQVELKVTKKRLIKIAFDGIKDKKSLVELKEKLKGIPALIFTKLDPFMLAKLLNKGKSKCAAKPGQTAPNDLIIPAGGTDFTAGPMIGEFGQMGIKTKVEDGKITILSDKVLVEEGEIIDDKAADLLSKMKIEPMEVGLNLLLTYENGEILTKDVLFIDEQEYLDNLQRAYLDSVGLSMEIGYVCDDVIERMISKAEVSAKAIEEKVDFGEISNEKEVKGEKKVEETKEEVSVEETPEEESTEEETPEEESTEEETPEEESTEEEIEVPGEESLEQPQEETPSETQKDKENKNPADFDEESAKKAQDLLQQVVDTKISEENKEKVKVPTAEELQNKQVKKEFAEKKKDVNDIINNLKDKKFRGEI